MWKVTCTYFYKSKCMHMYRNTVGRKIIQALVIIRIRKLIPNAVLGMSLFMFDLFTVYNKHHDDKNWRSNLRKIASIIANARTILLPTVWV